MIWTWQDLPFDTRALRHICARRLLTDIILREDLRKQDFNDSYGKQAAMIHLIAIVAPIEPYYIDFIATALNQGSKQVDIEGESIICNGVPKSS